MSRQKVVLRSAAQAVELICEEKKAQNLQWDQVAVKAGIARTTLCNWAYRIRYPHLETALMVFDALGYDVIVEPRKEKGGGQRAP